MSPGKERAALGYALAAVALWSTVATAFKIALKYIDPFDLLSLSVVVSWLSLGIVVLFNRPVGSKPAQRSPNRRQILLAGLLGLLNPLAYYSVLFIAYDRLPAQIAQPLNYTWPLFLAVLAAPIDRRPPGSRDLLGILISMIGVILISRSPGTHGGAPDTLGVVFALGSGVLWALYWLIGKRLEMDGSRRLFIGFSTALVPVMAMWLLRGSKIPGEPEAWMAVLWVGLFEMGITFLLWNAALERSRHPARIGNLVYLGPFVSLLWIALILGEKIRFSTVGGLAVIVIGILIGQGVLAFKRHRREL